MKEFKILSDDDFLNGLAIFTVQVQEVDALGQIVHIDLVSACAAVMVELVNIDGFAHHIHHACIELLSFVGSNLNIHERSGRVRIYIDFSFVKLINAIVDAIIFKLEACSLEHVVSGEADDESGRRNTGHVIERSIERVNFCRLVVHVEVSHKFLA